MLAHLLGWTVVALGFAVISILAVRDARVLAPLLVAFLTRVLLVVVHVYLWRLPGTDADPANFLQQGLSWSSNGVRGALANFHTGAAVYSSLLALVFAFLSPSEFMALAINATAGALVTWNVWRLVLVLTSDTAAAKHAAWITALFPSTILFSVMTLREVAVVYPFTLGLLYLMEWWQGESMWRLYAALSLFLISSAFHSGMVFVFGAILILMVGRWFNDLLSLRGQAWMRTSAAGCGLLCAGLLVVLTGVGLEKFARVASMDPSTIAIESRSASRSRAGYLQGDIPTSVTQVLAQLPLRTAYFLFSPFPWMVSSLGDAIAMLDALAYLAAFIGMFRHRRYIMHDPPSRALTVILFVAILPFAAATSNYGTALRHRAKLAPLVCVLFVVSGTRRVAEHEEMSVKSHAALVTG